MSDADDGTHEFTEGNLDIGAALVAHVVTAELREPGEGALDHPAMATELLAALDAASGDSSRDRASPALRASALVLVGRVGVQFDGAAPRPATTVAKARNGVQGWRQHHAVVAVGVRLHQAKQRALLVGDEVALGARPAAVLGVQRRLWEAGEAIKSDKMFRPAR